MAEYIDPRTFLPSAKLHLIKSRTGMDEPAISAAFMEFDRLLKDAAPPAEQKPGKEAEPDRIWQLMGVLGDDSPRYIVPLRAARAKRASRELLENPLIRGEPALEAFLANIGSTRISPGQIDAYGRYADELSGKSEGPQALSRSEELIRVMDMATGRSMSVNRYPEPPPEETRESLYHKLRTLDAIRDWMKKRDRP